RPSPSRPNAFREQHGFGDAFVVMYSGNHGVQNPLATLLDAARELEAREVQARQDILFVFIGGGVGKLEVERRIEAGASNLRSLPFEPLARIGTSLSAADVHVVSLADKAVGIIHPCKVYGAMAIGRPILFFGPPESHVGDILRHGDIGRTVSHGDVTGAVAAVEELAAIGESARATMGRRAMAGIAESFTSAALQAEFCGILEEAAR
ncbi:MAG: glycosyltransferase, partial [Planctomycetia bacterium]